MFSTPETLVRVALIAPVFQILSVSLPPPKAITSAVSSLRPSRKSATSSPAPNVRASVASASLVILPAVANLYVIELAALTPPALNVNVAEASTSSIRIEVVPFAVNTESESVSESAPVPSNSRTSILLRA